MNEQDALKVIVERKIKKAAEVVTDKESSNEDFLKNLLDLGTLNMLKDKL